MFPVIVTPHAPTTLFEVIRPDKPIIKSGNNPIKSKNIRFFLLSEGILKEIFFSFNANIAYKTKQGVHS